MPAESYANVGGTYRRIGAVGEYARVGGVWQPVNFAYANVGGGWQTTYVRDVTGPGPPTNCRATFEPGGLRITWTNPGDADYASMSVNVAPGTDPYIFGGRFTTNNILWTADAFKSNIIYHVQLIPIDTNGNAGGITEFASMQWTGAARGRTPSPTLIWPVDSGTYYREWAAPNGAWRTDYPYRVWQGGFASGEFIGMYFYGDQFWNLLRGTTISAASAQFFRVNSEGTPLPVSPAVVASNCVSKAFDPRPTLYEGPVLGAGMSMAGDPYPPIYNLGWPLPSSWFDNMNSSVSRFNAMGLWANDATLRPDLGGGNVTASFMQMFGADEAPYNIHSGAITVDHSG